MTRRTVYGKSFSENGWPMVDTGSCQWTTVPGTSVTLQIQVGEPLALLRAFAADFNEHVEPLRDRDSACWTLTNKVSTSNHLSGSGMDLNWDGPDGKTFRYGISKERAYPGDKARKLDELLEFYEGMIFCGGNWDIRDWMHFQVGGNTFGNPRTADFIKRKIRPDGFSTFRRGSNVIVDPVSILARATGLPPARAGVILPAVRGGLLLSSCTSANRIAMWLAQIGHESDNFNATEEYENGDGGVTERWKYKGRTWIQLTWLSNYAGFSKWAYERGLIRSPNYFVDHPEDLANLEFAGLGAAYYWTVARPTLNALSDARNINEVTRLINGGYNGLTDRQKRYDRALAVGNDLLQLTATSGDDMAQVPQEQWDRALFLLEQVAGVRRESKSPLRHVGEGAVNTCAGFSWSGDGLGHPQFVFMAAKLGHLNSIQLLAEVAAVDPAKHPERAEDAKLAAAMLAEVEAVNPNALTEFLAKKGVT